MRELRCILQGTNAMMSKACTLLLLLLITSTQTGCLSGKQIGRAMGEAMEQAFTPGIEISGLACFFYQQNGCWPASAQELECFTKDAGASVDHSLFINLIVQKQSNGDLAIRYELAPPAQGAATIIIPPPRMTGQTNPASRPAASPASQAA